MEEIKISIIVPAYNVGTYIEKCADSVLNQTYRNIELIIVEDGSKDDTCNVCDRIKKKDDRVIVIHQENQGPSAARNNGMAAATGDYIAFLDGDDRWNDKAVLNKVIEEIKKNNSPDIIVCSFTKKNLIDNSITKYSVGRINASDIGQLKIKLLNSRMYHNAAWSKIYRRDFLISNGMSFPVGRISEDLVWSRIALTNSETIGFLSEPLVEYQIGRSGSITSNFTHKNYIDIYEQMKEDLDSVEKCSIVKKQIPYAFWAEQCCWYFSYFDVSGKDLISTIQENDFAFKVMKYGLSKRAKLINLSLKIFGKKATVNALIAYQHRRLDK